MTFEIAIYLLTLMLYLFQRDTNILLFIFLTINKVITVIYHFSYKGLELYFSENAIQLSKTLRFSIADMKQQFESENVRYRILASFSY